MFIIAEHDDRSTETFCGKPEKEIKKYNKPNQTFIIPLIYWYMYFSKMILLKKVFLLLLYPEKAVLRR